MILLVLIIVLVIISSYIGFSYEGFKSKCDALSIKIQAYPGSTIKILHNSKHVYSVYDTIVHDFIINEFKKFDELALLVDNTNNKGGFICTCKINGQTYYSDRNMFTCLGRKNNNKGTIFGDYRGGKYMGCYRDSSDRILDQMMPGSYSTGECYNQAVQNMKPFYGLQAGRQCFLGYDYMKGARLEDSLCNSKCTKNNEEYCGGIWANDVYSSIEPPPVEDYFDKDRVKRDKNISGGAKWVWIEGKNMDDSYMLGEYKFTWIYQPPDKIPFCPFQQYDNYLPSGCSNPKTDATCLKSAKKDYRADELVCNKKLDINEFIRDGSFVSLILNCYNNINKGTKVEADFLKSLNELYSLSCGIIKDNGEYDSDKAYCDLEINNDQEFKDRCRKTPVAKRECPNNISADLQKAQKNTLEYDMLKAQCKYNKYCFDDKSGGEPKCFKPTFDTEKYVIDSDYKLFNAIDKAIELNCQRQNKQLKIAIVDLVKKAKILQYDSDYGFSCPCRTTSNQDDLSCFPC